METPNEPVVPRDQQEPLYAAIADELITLTPETWNAVLLEVLVETSAKGVLGMSHTISSLEGHQGPIIVSDELSDLTHTLLVLFQQHRQPFTGMRFEVRHEPDGDWRYTCRFSYAQRESTPPK